MEDKKQSKEEYQFIREKVIKKKSRVGKVIRWTTFTIFLAAIFGVVARFVFLYADEPLRKLLGISSHGGAAVLTPTDVPEPPDESAVPTPEPTPIPTETAGLTPEATKMPKPTPTPMHTTPTPIIIKSPAVEYEEMYAALREVAQQAEKSLVTLSVSVTGTSWLDGTYEIESETTGVVVERTSDHVLILTSLSRVAEASQVSVNIFGELYEAKLWKSEENYDLAVLAVSAVELPLRFLTEVVPAAFGDTKAPETGTPILALGNPNGHMGSMEFGMVTGIGSKQYIMDNSIELFQTDTSSVDAGDGVIVNLRGEILGLITHTLKPTDESMCTVLGVTEIRHILKKMIAQQDVVYFGIIGEDIPTEILAEQGLGNGIYVAEVVPDSPADKAGIRMGDIILQFDESNIYSYRGFQTCLGIRSDGDEVKIKLMRTVRMIPKQMELAVVLKTK